MPEQDAFKALAQIGPRRHSLALWIWSALLVADAVLATRCLSGHFTDLLPAPLAVICSLIVAMASLAAWYLYTSIPRSYATPFLSIAPQAVSLVITAVWCGSLSVATSSLGVGLLFSIVLLQLGVLAASSTLEPSEALRQETQPERPAMAQASVPAPTVPAKQTISALCDESFSEHDEPTDEEEAEIDEGLTLWLSRRTADDSEQIEGWVRVEFAAGQRETVVHVAFCPPLPGIPEIETEDLAGAELEIRVATAFAFGARLSVRRSGAVNESSTVRVGFHAQAGAANRAA